MFLGRKAGLGPCCLQPSPSRFKPEHHHPQLALALPCVAMDGWANPNPSDHGYLPSPTEPLHSTTVQQRPSHHQEQSEAQIPVASTPLPRHTVPPPASQPNKPAPWQLGRHSQYIPGTSYDQRSSNPSVDGFPEVHGGGRWDPVRVQHQVSATEEGKMHDVEEELHRRLKARQVRLPSVLRVWWLPNASHRFQ